MLDLEVAQEALHAVAAALHARAPQRWIALTATYRTTGGAQTWEMFAITRRGVRLLLDAGHDQDAICALFADLRDASRVEGRGDWDTAIITVTPDHHIATHFDFADARHPLG